MSSRLASVLVVFCLVLFVQSGLGLQCWDCDSSRHVMCDDPMNATDHFSNGHKKVCESMSFDTSRHICRKIVKRVNGERVVIRQCATPNVDEIDIRDGPCSATATSGHNIVESCHICSTDLCNSATNASVMQPLFIVTLAIIGYRSLQSKYDLL